MLFNRKIYAPKRKQKSSKSAFLAGCIFAIFLLGISAAVQAEKSRIQLLYSTFDPLITDPAARIPGSLLSDQSDSDLSAGIYIVQFNQSPLPVDQQLLKDLGVTIYSPLAEHALIVLMTNAVRKTVENLSVVRWVGRFHAAYKLEEGLAEQSDTVQSVQAVRYSIMLFESGKLKQQIVADRIEQLGGSIELLTESRRMEATFAATILDEIAQMPEVLFIELWTPAENDMDMVRSVSGASFLETVVGYTGQGVRGEVLDDGLRLSHQDFQSSPALLHGANNSDNNHGTSTYGIVFGSGASDQRATGLLPDAEQPIFSSYKSLGDRYAHTRELVDPNGDYRAVFQSNSWGNSRTTRYTTVSAEMDQIIFDHDIVITQSQSNEGTRSSRPQAWAKNIVAVGGIRGYDTVNRSDDRWNGSASIGPANDGRIKPDISHFYDAVYTSYYRNNTSHTDFGGTSASTPIASGYFGLMFQMWADGVFSGNPGLQRDVFDSRPHSSTARALIINSASQYQFSGSNHDRTRVHQGWGFPDVQNLYQEAESNGWRLPILIDETEILNSGQTHLYTIEVVADANTPIKATMVYLDPPGIPNSSVQRINDLTLKVTSPTGVVYWGNNGLLSGNWSTPGGTANTIDTVENVFIETPEEGVWSIAIQGTEIVQDAHIETTAIDADYALVVTGGIASDQGGNLPPVADAGSDQSVNSGTTVTLQGDSFDPDGSIASYQWTQVSGDAVDLSGANLAIAVFTAPQVDADTQLVFSLEVTDDQGLTANDQVIITVGDLSTGEGADLAIDSLTYTVQNGVLVRVGKRLSVETVVVNSGTALAAENSLRWVLSTDPVIDMNDRHLGSGLRKVRELDSGNSRLMKGAFRIPLSVVPGTYYLGAIVDTANVVAESNETNNTAAVQIVIKPKWVRP